MPGSTDGRIDVVVWGTGNMGRASLRAVVAHPALRLVGVVVSDPAKVGRDAADLAGIDVPTGVTATSDVDAVLSSSPGAVAYCASGDVRPDEALDDVERCLRAGATVVTPALYALYDPASAPEDLTARVNAACAEGGSSLFVSGVDPGWGNDVLPLLLSGLTHTVREVRCQEIFDYSTYQAEAAVRDLIGFGHPLSFEPPMVMATVPTMVWGGQLRLMARAMGVTLDRIDEHVERRPLLRDVTTALGHFAEGTQGALRFEVRGIVGDRARLVIEHVTRIHPEVAPDWPAVPDGGAGAHRVIIEGSPRLDVTVVAEEEGGNRAAGGNATAANRLVGAIPWLAVADPAVYDALDVPLPAGNSWAD